MLNVEQIRRKLKENRCSFIAKDIGVNKRSIERIRDGYSCNLEIIKKLSHYFENKDQHKKTKYT